MNARILFGVAVAVVAVGFSACGGGGSGGGGGGGAPTTLAVLQAKLQGSSEVSVVDPGASAAGVFEVRSDGQLHFSVTGDTAWTPDVTGLHIHQGVAGAVGPNVADLLGNGATFDGTGTATDTLFLDAALAANIAANPAAYYVNVFTTDAPSGLVRSQLDAFTTPEWRARLLGTEETPPVDPTARGAASFSFQSTTEVRFVVATQSPAIGTFNGAHIHSGHAGIDGPILVDLMSAPDLALDGAAGTMTGTLTLTFSLLSRMLADTDGFYVNLHTPGAGALGIVRGQIGTGPVTFTAALAGDEEVPPVLLSSAAGGVSLFLDTFTTGSCHVAVPPAVGINSLTGAHVALGVAGANGPDVIDLRGGADYTSSIASFSSEGAISYDQTLYTRILGNPEGFYANVQTAVAPSGLARGQLSDAPVSFFAALAGSNEVTVVDPSASGTVSLVCPSPRHGAFTARITNPPVGTVNGLRLHDGIPGVVGPTLIDLFHGSNVQISGTTMTGEVEISGRTVTRLLAAADRFYTNAYTPAASGGICRGQMISQDSSSPPAGISYATPVSYLTGIAITPNAPTSSGGNIASYDIQPALPTGLSINPTTGVVSGTPMAAIPPTDFTVTGTNGAGSDFTIVNIEVVLTPPSGLSYTTPVTYVLNQAITANVPTISGGPVATWSVNPPLPTGLTLSPTNGTISGTPTVATPVAGYQVQAHNSAGDAFFTVTITVEAVESPPGTLTYTTSTNNYPTGYDITPNNPTVTGANLSYSVSPALPSGLSIDASTGVISGMPTTVTSTAVYQVTVSNSAGFSTRNLSITITLGAPCCLSYNNVVGYQSTPIPTTNPTIGGGAATLFTINPGLPKGLGINASTGSITGTPAGPSASTVYTVTASNATNSTTGTVTIIVY